LRAEIEAFLARAHRSGGVGGVGERLLAGAACPVAVAPCGYADDRLSRLECIGVGVDASDEARRGLDAAVALARASGARLRVITAFQPLVSGGVTTTALPSASLNEVMRTDLRASHEAAIAEAPGSVETAGRFFDGSAEEVLEAESEDVDLLVTGSRGYGPLGAVLLGSVTSALFHNARCPVLHAAGDALRSAGRRVSGSHASRCGCPAAPRPSAARGGRDGLAPKATMSRPKKSENVQSPSTRSRRGRWGRQQEQDDHRQQATRRPPARRGPRPPRRPGSEGQPDQKHASLHRGQRSGCPGPPSRSRRPTSRACALPSNT
jgi:nucleotide-binding universal stress UspA family protein